MVFFYYCSLPLYDAEQNKQAKIYSPQRRGDAVFFYGCASAVKCFKLLNFQIIKELFHTFTPGGMLWTVMLAVFLD